MSITALELARLLGQPKEAPSVTYGQVTAVSLTSSPPTITVQIDGFTVDRTNVVWPANSYTPAVNDQVICLVVGPDLIVFGTIPEH